ncbi:hypothetical protein [Cryobacterium adonitolivorans]|uniref:hypothetical protein n=1 Tax=Cryobacterium adonitolivorans TaxID=1259189 RepID=UPI001F5470E7|nr:hypothetical protein [Cryobacterium adonitolivorans]
MAELRAGVLRPGLERLGRWAATRVRQRLLTAFDAAHTWERHGFTLEHEDQWACS